MISDAAFAFRYSAYIIQENPREYVTGEIVGPTGIEPMASRVSGERSSQLSYGPICEILYHLQMMLAIGTDIKNCRTGEGTAVLDDLIIP